MTVPATGYPPHVPHSGEPNARVADGGRSAGKRALWLFVASIGLFALTIATMMAADSAAPGVYGFGVASVVAVAGAVLGFASLAGRLRAVAPTSPGFTAAVVLAMLGNGAMALLGALSALMSTANFSRGRQLRRFGQVLLPPVHQDEAWAALPLRADVDEPVRSRLAAQWRENGRTEHASVAAFARLTLDLMALGAPPALVGAANRDALDEIRHTELCFSLARAIDGQGASPGPFPEAQRARTLSPVRTLALAALAVDSLVDGALHEGLSARVVARLAKRCEDPPIRAVLKEIAADEGRHAAHGWEVVEWCLAEAGAPVAHALAGALEALPKKLQSPMAEEAAGGGWERYGIPGRALEAEELARTRADVVRRVEGLIRAAAPAVAA